MAAFLLLALYILASSSLVLTNKSNNGIKEGCNVSSENEMRTLISVGKVDTETLFYVKPTMTVLDLNFILRHRDCLDKYLSKRFPFRTGGAFRLGEWKKLRINVDSQGFRVSVNGQEKMNIEKDSSCHKLVGVDVEVGRGASWSVGCDPRIYEKSSTTKKQTTFSTKTTLTTTTKALTRTKASTKSGPDGRMTKDSIYYLCFGILFFLSTVIIILMCLLKWRKSTKSRLHVGANTPRPVASLENPTTFVSGGETLLLISGSNADFLSSPPPVPPPIGLHHAQSMTLGPALRNDAHLAHTSSFSHVPLHQGDTQQAHDSSPYPHTLPEHQSRTGAVRNPALEGARRLESEDDLSDHIYEEMDEGGATSNREPASVPSWMRGSHESLNSLYGAL